MAFCNHCGAQLEGDGRFCVKCGHDVKANGAAAPGVASVPVAAGSMPAGAPQVVAPPPQGYVAPPPQGYAAPPAFPGEPPIPIVMGAPPAQSKHNGWIWAVVIVAVLYGLYYIGTHDQKTQPGTNPTQQPAQQPQGQPGGNPGQQPGGQGPGGNNAALASEQAFSGQATIVSGTVQITNARWTNNSNVAIQTATLECVVYDANRTTLGQIPFTLSGPNNAPVQPGATINFNTIQSSTGRTNASSVNCSIEGVSPAN